MDYKMLSSYSWGDEKFYEDIYNLRYNSESTYRFDFDISGNNAFLVINHNILQRIEKILQLDKKLIISANAASGISIKQYAKKCIVDEIKMTNEIEGVHSTRKEINDILNNKSNGNVKKNRLYGLVKKYSLILEGKDIKLDTCSDVRKLYDEFALKDVIADDPDNKPDGEIFRKGKVCVQNNTGKIIHRGLLPESEIIRGMETSLKILNNDDYNFFIRIAIFHYMFGYVHPFYDGNGRMSRFISSYLLSKKLTPLISLKLSYTIKQELGTYYKMFKETNDKNNKGELTHFTIRFLDIIIKSIEDLINKINEGNEKYLFFFKIANNISNSNKKLLDVLNILIQNSLFADNGLSIDELILHSEVSESKTREIIKILNDNKLLFINKEGRKYIYDINLNELKKATILAK